METTGSMPPRSRVEPLPRHHVQTAFLHVQECQHTILWRCDHALPTGVQCVPRADFPLRREASTRREREERSEVCPHLKVP